MECARETVSGNKKYIPYQGHFYLYTLNCLKLSIIYVDNFNRSLLVLNVTFHSSCLQNQPLVSNVAHLLN